MPGPSNPEGGSGETDYSSYLFIDQLLELQKELTPGADDELLFIVVHQVYELWFKLIIHELEGAGRALFEAKVWRANRRLERAVKVEELLVEQLKVLETMSPEAFYAFRDPLAPASGFQSVQFREIEVISGGFGASPGAVERHSEAGRSRLGERRGQPTLWDGCLESLRRHGLLAGEGEEAVLSCLQALYEDHDDPLRASFHELFERLVDHDEVIARWRYHHMLMAAREIGRRPGTGGSLGVEYLRRTLDKRFFPLLWEIRSRI